MNVTTYPRGTRFTVTPENEYDQALIDALDFERTVHVIDVLRGHSASGGYTAECVTLEVSRASPAALEAQTGREALRALRKVISLGLGEPAGHGLTPAETATVVKKEAVDDYRRGKDDPMYVQAVELVRTDRKASISYVQRKLRIGYNRTARMLEAMEKDGIVSPMTEVGGREVIA